MKGPLRGVIEVTEGDESGTYRTMYTTKISEVVYVLHAFQKKSRHGVATPQRDLDLAVTRTSRTLMLDRSASDVARTCFPQRHAGT